MPVTLGTNVGQANLRFSTPVTGGVGAVRVVSGNARIGSEGLIVDVLPFGVNNIIVREPGIGDTLLTVYGVEQISAADTVFAIAGKGLNDAAARSAVAGAANIYAGLNAIGVAR